MTIYLPNFDTLNKISFNGDFSGVSQILPMGYKTYYLELESRYTNLPIGTEWGQAYKFSPQLIRLDYNERYTEFMLVENAALNDLYKSGMVNWTLWGSYLEIVNTVSEFDPLQWNKLATGLAKVETRRTEDMQRSLESAIDTVKYQSPNDKAESYVIYKP